MALIDWVPGGRTFTKGADKVAFSVLIVECSMEFQDQVSKVFCQVFNSYILALKNKIFLLIRSSPQFTQDFLFNMGISHNKTQHNMKRVTLRGVESITTQIHRDDPTQSSQSITEFLRSSKDKQDDYIFISIDKASYGRTLVIFDISKENKLETL